MTTNKPNTKNCPLCMNIYDIDNLKEELEVIGTTIVKYRAGNENQLGIYIETGDSSMNGVYVDDIHFCPMCGRKLKGVE